MKTGIGPFAFGMTLMSRLLFITPHAQLHAIAAVGPLVNIHRDDAADRSCSFERD